MSDDLPRDEQSRPLSHDGDWFWQRPGDDEPTREVPAEQTRVIPSEQTRVIPAEQTREIPAEQTREIPAAQTPGALPAPRRRGGAGGLALVGLGALSAVLVMQGARFVDLAGTTVSPASQPSVTQPQQEPSQQGGWWQDPQTQPDQQPSSSSSSVPAQGSGGSSPVPAEQQPFDPWGGGTPSDQSPSGGTAGQDSTQQAQDRATTAQSRGVVLIDASSDRAQGAGTGMVISSDGYVLTNYHVVQSSTEVQVEVASSGREYTAEVVGHDAANDVALLKLRSASGLDTITVDQDELATGDRVTAVGNSRGQGFLSQAGGTVTSLSASITVDNEASASGRESLTDVIRTSAQAVPGDSGGPLYDAEGEVVGMTTAGQQAPSATSTSAVTLASFAVPIDRAMGIIEQIRSGQESGTVKVGANAYLGVSVQTLRGGGLVVASVVPDGPAARAGLRSGDRITRLGDASVDGQAALATELARHEPGDRVSVTWTDESGDEQRGSVTLGSSPIN